jgi:Tfp pilus assembly protein PilE
LSHSLIELLCVIGFAASTILGVVIVSYRSYKEYTLKKQLEKINSDEKLAKQQTEIEKWKRKVFRP